MVMNYKYLITQFGNEGGAPIVGLELNEILKANNKKTSILNLEEIVEHFFLYSIHYNVDSYESKVRLAYDYLKNLEVLPDIIIVNSSRSGYFVTAAKKLCLKVILYIHEGPVQFQSEISSKNIRFEDLYKADYILNASKISINYFLSIDPEEKINKKLFLLKPYSNYDLNSKKTLDDSKNNLLNSFKKRYNRLFGACGTCCRRKGLDRFLSLAKELPKFGFIWAGSTKYVISEFGKDFYEDLKNTENILLLNHIKDPLEFYLSIDCLIHFSREDPSPLVSWEAASLRLAQISFSEEIGNPEVLSRNGILIFGNFNLDLLTKFLSNNPKEFLRHPLPMRQNIRVKTDFNYDFIKLLKLTNNY